MNTNINQKNHQQQAPINPRKKKTWIITYIYAQKTGIMNMELFLLRNTQIILGLKDKWRTEWKMGKEPYFSQKGGFMMGNGITTKCMGKVYYFFSFLSLIYFVEHIYEKKYLTYIYILFIFMICIICVRRYSYVQ